MSIEINNESGAEVDEVALAKLGQFVIDALRVNPLVHPASRAACRNLRIRSSALNPDSPGALDQCIALVCNRNYVPINAISLAHSSELTPEHSTGNVDLPRS